MESAVHHSYDGSLVLKAVGSANVTATAVGDHQIPLYLLTGGRGDLQNRYGLGSFDVVVHINSLDHTTGDETYVLTFETYDADGASNETIQESVTLTVAEIGATLTYTFHPNTMQKFHATAAFLGVKLTLGGTTPIANYWAFASQAEHAA
jgi:hypothetical protein